MKFLLSICTLCTFLPSLAFAQSGSVSGVVFDASDQQNIEFATVTLFSSSDSVLIGGSVTSPEGVFFINEIPIGEFYLRVSFIGYQQLTIDNLRISEEQPTLDLDSIALTPIDLDGVEVISNSAIFETKIDKKIFNADQSMLSKGGTGLDLLRQIPTIIVDQNDNIFLRGDGNVLILIDGRPTSLPANQLLKQMPATAIQKVEIITNPSAKYDPEGMSGIINVILKKSKAVGLNGSANATFGYGRYPKYVGGLSLSYKSSKLSVFGSFNGSNVKYWVRDVQDRSVLLADTTWDILRSLGEYDGYYFSGFGNFGVDYYVNDKNTVYISGMAFTNESGYDGFLNYEDFNENEFLESSSIRNVNAITPGFGYTLNGGWQKNFKKDAHTLDIDVNYSIADDAREEEYKHDYYDNSNSFTTTNYQNTGTFQRYKILLAKIDYAQPFDNEMNLEAGFHFTGRNTNNRQTSESAGLDAIFSPDTSINNEFNYNQNTFAPYLTISKQFKKIGLKAGVRAEQTLTLGILKNTGEEHVEDYFKLFPSVHMSYKTKKRAEFQLSYSRRINRPDFYFLNPFYGYWDIYTIERGNPFLKPEIIDVVELNFMQFWEKFNISSSVYYRNISNSIRRNLTNEDELTFITYDNLGSSHLVGGDLTLTFLPVKNMRIISSSNVWSNTTRDVVLTQGERRTYYGLNTNIFAMIDLKKGWSFQLSGNYAPRQAIIQGAIYPNFMAGFAIGKQLFKNKANLNISLFDIFKTAQYTFESEDINNFNLYMKTTRESRSIYITFTYNFGKMIDGKYKRDSKGDASDGVKPPGIE